MKVCVFAGTFDPITKGHAFVIEKCLETFDKVIVAVGVNVDKTPAFNLEQRVEMIKRAYKNEPRVVVETFSGMLVDFMKSKGVIFNVRGIRDVKDYEYETTMERYNRDMYPEITTLFIPTPKDLVYVSSTAIRNILNNKSDASKYLPDAVAEFIKELNK